MDMTKIRLFSGRCLVLPDEIIGKTKGGLFLPDQSKETPRRGKIIAVAKEPHRYDTGAAVPIEYKVGEHVVYARHGGIEYRDEETGTEYLILTHDTVFGVLPD